MKSFDIESERVEVEVVREVVEKVALNFVGPSAGKSEVRGKKDERGAENSLGLLVWEMAGEGWASREGVCIRSVSI